MSVVFVFTKEVNSLFYWKTQKASHGEGWRGHLQKYLIEFYKPLSYLLHWNWTKNYSKQYDKYHLLSISTSMLHSTFIADTHFMRAFSSYLLFRTNGCHKTCEDKYILLLGYGHGISHNLRLKLCISLGSGSWYGKFKANNGDCSIVLLKAG